MDEAARCDTLLLMRAGQILATGSPDELMSRTKTSSVEGAFMALVETGAE
jgi:ABC-2 type transport system ATP-binding protein